MRLISESEYSTIYLFFDMVDITLTVDKEEVYEEVSRTTSYTGAKLEDTGDAGAYERIFTVDEDKIVLNRFWEECKSVACNSLKRFLSAEREFNGVFSMDLELSNSFDRILSDSMQQSLFSFFVTGITARWFVFTNKAEAPGYFTQADTYLEDVLRKVFSKMKPIRPHYD